jgi:hypothetical protein
MLEDPRCKLDSLAIYNVGKCIDLSAIASGIAKNTSIKEIAYNGNNPQLLLGINTLNHTVEKVDLSKHVNVQAKKRVIREGLAVALKGFRELKSLNLSRSKIMPETYIAIFNAVLTTTSKVENLILNCQPGCNDSGLDDKALCVLGECVAANNKLRRLGLFCVERKISTTTWVSFIRKLRNIALLKLETIDLRYNQSIDDNTLQDLMNLFRSAVNLKTVKLPSRISSNGANRLMDMLHQTSIQNINALCKTLDSNLYGNFYSMLRNGGLKMLSSFGWLNAEIFPHLLNNINNPNCRLEKFKSSNWISTRNGFSRIIFGWAEVLKRNSTIKSLGLECRFEVFPALVDFWHEYSKLLCD